MTKNQFDKLTGNELIQPNGENKHAYPIININRSQGVLEIKEIRYFSKSSWYRFENVDIVTYKKVLDKDTFDEKELCSKVLDSNNE